MQIKSNKSKRTSKASLEGSNKSVALSSMTLIAIFLVLTVINPSRSATTLMKIQTFTIAVFGSWYVFLTACLLLISLGLALWPSISKIKLGPSKQSPDYSNFSWFSMMFSAGIGGGMLTFSTAEPVFHFGNNPDVIKGLVDAYSLENIPIAFKWAFFHYGLTPWACYSITGLALAHASYNLGHPLSFRFAVKPLFGRFCEGIIGDFIDIVAILATIIGVCMVMGYGISQLAFGLSYITGIESIIGSGGSPHLYILLVILTAVICIATFSAISGVGRGIKWLSNLNISLSLLLLAIFAIFGSSALIFKSTVLGLWEYISQLPVMSLSIWKDSANKVQQSLADWQGAWTIFYWAWWIAFTPFVGLFLARVSRGRTIREYILGSILFPSAMCFTWFILAGGAAIFQEVGGAANGEIINSDVSAQLFATLDLMLSPAFAVMASTIVVILLFTFLITSADSAILVVNTITSKRQQKSQVSRIVTWSTLITAIVTVLLFIGGLEALRSAMIVVALPFSFVLGLISVALVRALVSHF